VTVEVSFWEDFVALMRAQLAVCGLTPPADGIDVVAQYLNLERRRVAPRARLVSVARGLVPTALIADAYRELLRKLEHGEDVTPHLSRSVLRDADYHDGLLDDWGMHHFHLGTSLEADGMVARTNELVFAIIRPNDAYVAGIHLHGQWAVHALIDAVQENWPELLRPLALCPGPRLSPPEHARARRSNLHVVTVLANGMPVLGAGGGITSSGHSLAVSVRTMRIREEVDELERRFNTMVPEIQTHLERSVDACTPRFRLMRDPDGSYQAVDEDNRIAVLLCTPEAVQHLP